MIAIGGAEDHVHLLFALPPTISLSEAMKKLKANTSRWINETFSTSKFAWQEGYGAFSVGIGSIPAAKDYIERQLEHHRKREFQSEFESMLKQHGFDVGNLPSFGLGKLP